MRCLIENQLKMFSIYVQLIPFDLKWTAVTVIDTELLTLSYISIFPNIEPLLLDKTWWAQHLFYGPNNPWWIEYELWALAARAVIVFTIPQLLEQRTSKPLIGHHGNWPSRWVEPCPHPTHPCPYHIISYFSTMVYGQYPEDLTFVSNNRKGGGGEAETEGESVCIWAKTKKDRSLIDPPPPSLSPLREKTQFPHSGSRRNTDQVWVRSPQAQSDRCWNQSKVLLWKDADESKSLPHLLEATRKVSDSKNCMICVASLKTCCVFSSPKCISAPQA